MNSGLSDPNGEWWQNRMNQLCKVCGEPAAGYHFGAFTCEGCKSFFGRTYNNLSALGECKNNGQCVINKKNRTSCKSCRLKKCLMVGMSKSGSRYGRRSNWFKIHCLIQDQAEMQSRISEHPNFNFMKDLMTAAANNRHSSASPASSNEKPALSPPPSYPPPSSSAHSSNTLEGASSPIMHFDTNTPPLVKRSSPTIANNSPQPPPPLMIPTSTPVNGKFLVPPETELFLKKTLGDPGAAAMLYLRSAFPYSLGMAHPTSLVPPVAPPALFVAGRDRTGGSSALPSHLSSPRIADLPEQDVPMDLSIKRRNAAAPCLDLTDESRNRGREEDSDVEEELDVGRHNEGDSDTENDCVSSRGPSPVAALDLTGAPPLSSQC